LDWISNGKDLGASDHSSRQQKRMQCEEKQPQRNLTEEREVDGRYHVK
jgi:hypothetical protein